MTNCLPIGWGRFHDADESAYYEYICRRAGIDVQYVAEQFENDGSPVSTIVKGVKRAMAREYSRELSTNVFAGQCRLSLVIVRGEQQANPHITCGGMVDNHRLNPRPRAVFPLQKAITSLVEMP